MRCVLSAREQFSAPRVYSGMRRPLHMAVALSALPLGLLVAGAPEQIPYALPSAALAALLLPALRKRVRRPGFDAHRLKVVSITAVLWVFPLTFFYLFLFPPHAGCLVDLSDDYAPDVGVVRSRPDNVSVRAPQGGLAWPCYPGARNPVHEGADIVWAGAMDRKARSKPRPFYTPAARAAHAAGTISVLILVDESGSVLSAQPLAGHPLLQREAARAACFARFRPFPAGDRPAHQSGVLTYRFGT